MRIQVLSDLHLEHSDYSATLASDTDLVVLAGDISVGTAGVIWAKEQFPGLPVLYVPGNHEYYTHDISELNAALAEEAAGSNVHVLMNTKFELGGYVFLGTTLWTDFSLFAGNDPLEKAWAMVEAGRYLPDFDGRILFSKSPDKTLSPQMAAQLHIEAVSWLEASIREADGRAIVLTHHAPSALSLAPEYKEGLLSTAFASNLDRFCEKARLWIHGHTHYAVDYFIGACRVVSNPRGYAGERIQFEPVKIVEFQS